MRLDANADADTMLLVELLEAVGVDIFVVFKRLQQLPRPV